MGIYAIKMEVSFRCYGNPCGLDSLRTKIAVVALLLSILRILDGRRGHIKFSLRLLFALGSETMHQSAPHPWIRSAQGAAVRLL